jgi:hypothetical protein
VLVFANFGSFFFGLLGFFGGVFFFTIIVFCPKTYFLILMIFSQPIFLSMEVNNLSVILWQIFNDLLDLVSNLGALGVALKLLLT